ncbi:hypothetical protein KQI63_06535 [bacterium]|nr:hypothetical protein [bacterium]
MSQEKLKYGEFLRNLNDSIDEVFYSDIEEQKAVLRELGHDPEKVIREGAEQIAYLRAKQLRKIKAERTQAFLEKMQEKLRSVSESAGVARQRLEEWLSGGAGDPAIAMFRDSTALEDEDVRALLEDIDMLEEFKRFLEDDGSVDGK